MEKKIRQLMDMFYSFRITDVIASWVQFTVKYILGEGEMFLPDKEEFLTSLLPGAILGTPFFANHSILQV
jgi:uncharacterized membrane protein (DUF441 family)